jgi:hypothetical protein
MALKAVDNEVDAILSRKRKRTETESSALVLVPHKTLFILN